MGVTRLDDINSLTSRAKVGTEADRPTTPRLYYGSDVYDFETQAWRGGELYFTSDNLELHIQTATSGTTPTWRKLDTAFASTTSSSTSSSTSTTSSTSTSTSSTTSTSTSSSSSTSTSTSTSSTTTA